MATSASKRKTSVQRRVLGEPWDHKLPRSILTDNDLQAVAYSIRSALHYVTGTNECGGPKPLCVMCGNAMRLVVQSAEPMILRAAHDRIERAIGVTCGGPHPSGD